MQKDKKIMKIAYILPVWPADNETAILNQIVELRKNGFKDMHFFAFDTNIQSEKQLPKEFIEYKLTENITYLKQPNLEVKKNKISTKIRLILKSLPYLSKTFIKSPNVFHKALTKKEYGEYKKAFKIIYLIQPFLGKQLSFDYIHCHYAPNGIWGAILKDLGFLKGKLITTFHGYGINKLPQRKPANYYDFLISKSSFFTSNSKFTKQNAVKIGFPENKIHIIRIALNTRLYNYIERKYDKNECFQILTVAALRNVKGLEYSIAAVKKIRDKKPEINMRYLIAGEGYLKEELKTIIKNYKLEDYVYLLGYIQHNDLKKLYDEAHVFVLTSTITKSGNQEAQGLVFQEAQACGIPVIGSDTGGIPEGVLNNKSGFIIPDKSPEDIANKLLFFYNNPKKIREFGKQGKTFVEENFNIATETKKLIALYKTKI